MLTYVCDTLWGGGLPFIKLELWNKIYNHSKIALVLTIYFVFIIKSKIYVVS